jgi:hypothetical protein
MVNYKRPATAETSNRSKRIFHVGTDKINIINLPGKWEKAVVIPQLKEKTSQRQA